MNVGILKENMEGEKRVALIPEHVPLLAKSGLSVFIEKGAGGEAGYSDDMYAERGASIVERKEVFEKSDMIVCIHRPRDINLMHDNQTIIGMLDPFSRLEELEEIGNGKVKMFSLELLPRVTRAQSMDILSSQAAISGYKAVLMAANLLPKMFPMLITAAGTIMPSKVFVIGAGVAGLEAIAVARRLGADVYAYDIRPETKEQVESVGGKFVELKLEEKSAEDKGGYSKAMDEEFYRKQGEMMKKVLSESDVVITTAAVPGKKAPILIEEEALKGMKKGSIIVDIAAATGGNCELTEPGKTVQKHGVTIVGHTNLPSTVPYHASQMYSNNMTKFLLNLYKEGKIDLNLEDEIIRDTLIIKDGAIFSPRLKEILGIRGGND